MVKKRKLKDTRPLSGPVREKKDTGKACQAGPYRASSSEWESSLRWVFEDDEGD